jgi:hypothetical protein
MDFSTSRNPDFSILEDGTDTLSRNVDKILPFDAAYHLINIAAEA